eukprot:scpid69241/ scgid7020/ 
MSCSWMSDFIKMCPLPAVILLSALGQLQLSVAVPMAAITTPQTANGAECPPHHFSCPITQPELGDQGSADVEPTCIAAHHICDGHIHCPGGDDELPARCSASSSTSPDSCPVAEEKRMSPNCCVSPSFVCDGLRDCADGADEADCGNTGCENGLGEEDLENLVCSDQTILVLRAVYVESLHAFVIGKRWSNRPMPNVQHLHQHDIVSVSGSTGRACCNHSMTDGETHLVAAPLGYFTKDDGHDQQHPTESSSATSTIPSAGAPSAGAHFVKLPCSDTIVRGWKRGFLHTVKRYHKLCRK